MSPAPRLIAVDWGTSRLRAMLVSAEGAILDQTSADEGIMAVPPGGFPAVLRRIIAPWLDRRGRLPVMMAGMVGSRNGWIEAPYAACPASLGDLAHRVVEVPFDGADVRLVPGLARRDPDGTPDVMRGEETKVAGVGLANGTIVTPGTHSKWISIRNGGIDAFASFMTGDFYAALIGHTIIGRLAEEPEDSAGFEKGLAAARRKGGLTHQAFAARTSVLLGDMPGNRVGPYLSGLLIGSEIVNGLALDRPPGEIVVVADGVFGRNYTRAFEAFGVPVRIVDPETTFITGLIRILDRVEGRA
jgi:2-dehydro-3-deoxygalactonokinase